MIHRLIPSTLLALTAPATMAVGESAPVDMAMIEGGQVTIHERIVIRVPRAAYPVSRPMGRAAEMQPIVWKEHKGPKCLEIGDLVAAAIMAPDAVDLLLADGRRMRARLDRDCRSADFYSGLYIRPGVDGRICADRDSIRVRSGASCEIDHFRLLKPR